MSEISSPYARPGRGLLYTLYGYALVGLAAGVLPSLTDAALRFPHARAPVWIGSALLCAVIAVLAQWRFAATRKPRMWLGWLLVIATVAQAFVVTELIALAGLFIVAGILAAQIGALRGAARKALVAFHVIAAACWLGVALMMAGIGLIALSVHDVHYLATAYELMAGFDITLLAWLNFAATLSGIVAGFTSQWGLIRYWWVATKLGISLFILLSAFTWVHDSLEGAAASAARLTDTNGTAEQLGALPGAVAVGFGFAFLQLLAAMLLSLYKPGGRTPRGRRIAAARQATRSRDIPATVDQVRPVASDSVELALRPRDGDLRAWRPGSHIDLVLPSGLRRQYSLVGDPEEATYRIAVLREEHGRGGSREVHGLKPGDRVGIGGPRNHFELIDAPEYLFVAGGIGIVPFLPMIRAARAPWRLVYRGKSLPRMPFAEELRRGYGDRVALFPADSHPRPDLAAPLRGLPDGAAVYVCGPAELITAVEELMPTACPQGRFHAERFVPTKRGGADSPFRAELARSGQTVHVAAGQRMLSAIRDVVPGVDASCEDGVCGSCELSVVEGYPDHRDDVLQGDERARRDVIYPCVSRARGERIVIDI